MTTIIKADHIIRNSTPAGLVDEGVIVHVDAEAGNYWWVPSQERDKRDLRIKHYIKAPRKAPLGPLADRLEARSAELVALAPTGLAATPIAQLREQALEPRTLRGKNLVEALALMDQQWSWIEPLVSKEPVETLLDVEVVSAYARLRAEEFSVRPEQIVRAVRAYLIGQRQIAALLPGWERSGAPGKPRPPVANTEGQFTTRSGRRNIAVLKGFPELAGIQATPEVREKLRLGYKKYKTGKHISVRTAYAMTLAEYWAESVTITEGVRNVTLQPLEELPSFDQFRRHGPSADPRNSATRINLGAHRWERNHRALPGSERDRVVAATQWGGIDSTSDDQNLVLGIDRTIGLPSSWNTKVTEGWTGYILGFHSGFERESQMTTLLAIAHAATSKVAFCKRYGIDIAEDDWLALHLRRIRSDNGGGKSEAGIQTLTRADISMEFVESYRAEFKGTSESKHQTLHRAAGHQLAGSTQGERHRRGDANPAKDACRTHGEYMYHAIKEILYHNNVQRVEHLLTLEMRADKVEPTRASILKWLIKKGYVTTDTANMATIRAMCLPVLKGVVTRKGVQIFDPRTNEERLIPHLRYNSDALQATGLTNNGNTFRQEVTVHLNPSEIGKAWMNYKGLVELDLKTHDVELASLTLREWLEITDNDRLQRFLTSHKRLQLQANGAIERYDSNDVARRIKGEHEKLSAALGRNQPKKPNKREAAKLAKQAELQLKLDLVGDTHNDAAGTNLHGSYPAESANEPAWVIAARSRATNN